MTIEIRDYDPNWPALAVEAIDEVIGALPRGVITVAEHIGSTSVPGLAAKAVIDLMAATDDLDTVTAHEPVLQKLGYRLVETGMVERLLYRREGDVAYHLHVVTTDSWDTRNERLMSDHLRRHPADRDEYAALKRDLAGSTADGLAYTRGKTALIQRITDAARADRGLPSVNVWED